MRNYTVWLEGDPDSRREISALDANAAAEEFMYRHDGQNTEFTHFAMVIVEDAGGQARYGVEGRLVPEYIAKQC
jgi:hypothetical protein